MDITKRNGSTEQYDKEKIATAIKKSFISTKHEIDDATIYQMVQSVEDIVCTNHIKQNVERRIRCTWPTDDSGFPDSWDCC